MSQKKSLIYNIISRPLPYMIIQKLSSGSSLRKNMVLKYIKKKNQFNILDIGCGPAEILDVLPKCNYYGYDVDKDSINYAKKKYLEKNINFYCKKFSIKDINKLPKFDYVLLFGIMHHLNDDECIKLFKLIKKVLKKKAKILVKDPVLDKRQNFIAKYFIENDRGNNVRYSYQYVKLIKTSFKKIKSSTTFQKFLPYTWHSMVCDR